MIEDRRFADDLLRDFRFTTLNVIYRPYRYAKVEQLLDVLRSQKQLLLKQSNLKYLEINMQNEYSRLHQDVYQLQPTELLPPIERLSLYGYTFRYAWTGLHMNVNCGCLRSLLLEHCRRLEFLFNQLQLRGANLKELRIRSPIWREDSSSRKHQREIFQEFLDSQKGLEILELKSLGFSSSILSTIVNEGDCAKLRVLELQDLDHQLRTTTKSPEVARLNAFKSVGAEDIRMFWLRCPILSTFQIDLALRDLQVVSAFSLSSRMY